MKLNISTGYGKKLDDMITAVAKRCCDFDGVILICGEDAAVNVDADRVIVVFKSDEYLSGKQHNSLASMMKDRYGCIRYPIALRELESLLRSITAKNSAAPSVGHAIKYDPVNKTVTKHGRSATLTPKEAELFELLYGSRGKPVSRETLRAALWQDTSGTNAPDVYISYLRRKLTPVIGEGSLVNIRGVGYILKDE